MSASLVPAIRQLAGDYGAYRLPRPRDGGNLLFNGQDLKRISEKERRNLVGAEVAMIFQDPMTSLNPCYTVGFQIMEAIKVHQGGNKKTRRQRAIDLLNQVGIPDPASRLDVYPHQLSGGMSQRVMIAMAIACRPSC